MMEKNIIFAVFSNNNTSVISTHAWQYDYGQTLRIQGLQLPPTVEIHFAIEDEETSVTRVGVTSDNVTEVVIPDTCLDNMDALQSYNVYAYIYLTEERAGGTGYKITIPVKARPKPELFDIPEQEDLFRKAIEEVNASAERAETAEKEAESWAHGHKDYPEREEDNAAYYAALTKKDAASVSGRVEEAKKNIDNYVRQKEAELKGERGDVYFAAFKVVGSRLIMCSDPTIDKIHFYREGSRLKYRVAL